MQTVGNELERLALSQGDPVESDLLGRSAFNRYYYASYLITRKTLGSMQSNWKKTSHGNIPIVLEKELRNIAKAALKKQLSYGLLDKGNEANILSDLNAAGSELAQLLRHAYDARCLADYEPEVKTVRDGNLITLKTYKLSTAKEWPNRTSRLCARLLKIWKEIGLV